MHRQTLQKSGELFNWGSWPSQIKGATEFSLEGRKTKKHHKHTEFFQGGWHCNDFGIFLMIWVLNLYDRRRKQIQMLLLIFPSEEHIFWRRPELVNNFS